MGNKYYDTRQKINMEMLHQPQQINIKEVDRLLSDLFTELDNIEDKMVTVLGFVFPHEIVYELLESIESELETNITIYNKLKKMYPDGFGHIQKGDEE